VYVGTVATMLLHFTRVLAGLLCLLTVRVLWVVACHAFAQAHQLLVVLFLSSMGQLQLWWATAVLKTASCCQVLQHSATRWQAARFLVLWVD
jgi:hypothetical protein